MQGVSWHACLVMSYVCHRRSVAPSVVFSSLLSLGTDMILMCTRTTTLLQVASSVCATSKVVKLEINELQKLTSSTICLIDTLEVSTNSGATTMAAMISVPRSMLFWHQNCTTHHPCPSILVWQPCCWPSRNAAPGFEGAWGWWHWHEGPRDRVSTVSWMLQSKPNTPHVVLALTAPATPVSVLK